MFKVGQTVRLKPADYLIRDGWPTDVAERWGGKTRVIQELRGPMIRVDIFDRYNYVYTRDVIPPNPQMTIPFGSESI